MSTFRPEQLRQPLSLSGSFTGSFSGSFSGSLEGTASYAITASYAMNGGGTIDTSSLLTTASFNAYTSSNTSQFAGTSSFATTASYALFAANGGGGGTTFPYTGSAIISGSLIITGSTISTLGFTGSLQGTSSFAQNSVFRASAGTGISISPTSGTGSITITNTAPDQTVSLADGTGISVTGTYPNFTITNTAPYPGAGFLQLLYVFTQVGGSDPTYNGGQPLINTTGENYQFKRNNSVNGTYELTADSGTPFTTGRTAVYLTPGYTVGTADNGKQYLTWFEIISTTLIVIYSYEIGVGLTDSVFNNATLDIKIY